MGSSNRLLEDIEAWRLRLARDLDSRNPGCSIQDLDAMVQRRIERRVFMRLANRSEENDQAWKAATPELLGRVHEQFVQTRLIRTGHTLAIEPNRVRQKSGGIYYTPAYVVDYIVKNSLRAWLHDKTPEQARHLTLVDPACGCGVFLLVAQTVLFDWFLDQYVTLDPQKYRKRLSQTENGVWQLTDSERVRIVRRSLFGVDLDAAAVDITARSLWLNCRIRAFDPRTLSSLRKNIKCGNSLIDTPYDRTSGFDWHVEFPTVFRGDNRGFHFVFGNPPYHRERDSNGQLERIAATPFGKRYRSPRMDLWYYFVHRGIETLLQKGGTLAFITNAYWTAGTGAGRLIRQLQDEAHLAEIFHLGKLTVFDRVTGQHTIFRIVNEQSDRTTSVIRPCPAGETSAEPFLVAGAKVVSFEKTSRQLFRHGKLDLEPPADALLEKLERHVPLAALGRVRQGIAENPPQINVRTNEKFGRRWRVGEGVFALSPDEQSRLQLSDDEKRLLRPYHDACDLGRYWLAERPSRSLIYSTKQTCPDIDTHATIRDHLQRFRPIMEARRETRLGRNQWWHLHWPRDESLWQSTKIIALQMAKRPSFVAATRPIYVPFSTNVWVPFESTAESVYYITGVLNSRLLWKWFQHHAKHRGVGLEINGNVLSKAPIRKIDFDSPNERDLHDRIASAAEQLIVLNHQVRNLQTNVALERRIDHLDRTIDNAIYTLFSLTEVEIEHL